MIVFSRVFEKISNDMNCLGEEVDSKEYTELLHRFDDISKKLKICRGKVDSEAEEDPCELLGQLDTLIENWQGELPNFGHFFRRDDMDWLLTLYMKDIRTRSHYRRGRRTIDFVARSGYKDEPDLDENGKPSSRRTTPIHSIRRSNWLDDFMWPVENLFKIYDRFDVNYIDEFGCSHFHVACEYACTDAVKKFLELGQDPNLIEEESGESPLYMAVKHSSQKVIEVLFKRGANPILANRDGKTPLHIEPPVRPFFKMNKRIHQILQVNARDKFGRTPLQSALVCGHKKTVKWLLKLGADPNSANEWGWTPLHIICHRDRNGDLAELFFKICDKLNRPVHIDARNKLGQTPLHLALTHIRKKMFELLLKRGADPNLADNEGLTPLHVICKRYEDDDELAQMFFKINDELHQRVRVNVWDKKGRTPLQLALCRDNKKTAEILMRRGANLANEAGLTPLHSICQTYFYDKLAKMFFDMIDEFEQTVQVDAKDKSGRTPLQLAVANLKPKTIDVLLDRGADLSSFVFPNESNFDDCFDIYVHAPIEHKLIFASGLMAVVERLEARGYELDRSDALTIMKLFSKYGLFEKPINRAKCWYNDEKFATEFAKKKMVNSSLSLYDLIRLRPGEAEKRHTHLEFFELPYSCRWFFFQTEESCILHLCEKLSRGFFRRCAVYPFWELINRRLSIECCEMILEPLMNKDLYHICLAVTGQS